MSFQYLIKRFLGLFITLLLVSIVVFFISYRQADPTYILCSDGFDCKEEEKAYIRKKMGLDLPIFYLTINTAAYPDTFHRIIEPTEREKLDVLLHQFGNWSALQTYHKAILDYQKKIHLATTNTDTTLKKILPSVQPQIKSLTTAYEIADIKREIKYCKEAFQENNYTQHPLYGSLQGIERHFQYLQTHPQRHKNYQLALRWNGLENQYHKWLTKFVRLDFGESYDTRRSVLEHIEASIPVTIIISLISIVLAYLIAIPLGVLAAIRQNTRTDRVIRWVLFALYSLPNFWLATMLLFYLTDFFPAGGLTSTTSKTGVALLIDQAHHLVLPIICWTYPGLAYLAWQMRRGMLGTLQKDYIRTARAKGMTDRKVIWRHAYRNALIPIVTMLGSVLPRLITGSVILEYIFGLPGMGKILFDAIQSQDQPVVFTMVILLAILTSIGYLISDILIQYFDPRTR